MIRLLLPLSKLVRCLALCVALPALCQAQVSVEVPETSLKTVSASQPATEPESAEAIAKEDAAEAPESQTFRLALEHHPWARFQPGAWREIQTVTETFDADGQFVNRNVTTQKEILQAVTEDKYVLRLKATVDLVGKRIVGAWKTRVLYLATDGAEPMKSSTLIDNQPISLAGRPVVCQNWRIVYSDGTRNLKDQICFDPNRFPFVLKRETFVVTDQPEPDAEAKPQQVVEVAALDVPYPVGNELLSCCFQRTIRHRDKGDTVEMAITNELVPGGIVAVCSTDSNAEGMRVGWSATTLLAYGKDAGEEDVPAEGSSKP